RRRSRYPWICTVSSNSWKPEKSQPPKDNLPGARAACRKNTTKSSKPDTKTPQKAHSEIQRQSIRTRNAVMKANCWYGKYDLRVEQVPDPEILNPRDAI